MCHIANLVLLVTVLVMRFYGGSVSTEETLKAILWRKRLFQGYSNVLEFSERMIDQRKCKIKKKTCGWIREIVGGFRGGLGSQNFQSGASD